MSNDILNSNLALKAFEYVTHYDISIANYLGKEIGKEDFPKYQSLRKVNSLRYGENPHQVSSLYVSDYNDKNLEFEKTYLMDHQTLW